MMIEFVWVVPVQQDDRVCFAEIATTAAKLEKVTNVTIVTFD